MVWNPLEHSKPVPLKLLTRLPKLRNKISAPYAIIGAVAMKPYFPERQTYSLDLLIETQHFQEVAAALSKHASHQDLFDDSHRFYTLKWSRAYLCLINSSEAWVKPALEAAQKHLYQRSPSLPLPWLLLSKMWCGTRQDFLDSARLVARASQEQIDETKALFETYLPEAIPELRSLYKIGKAELNDQPAYKNKPNAFSAWYKLHSKVNTDL